MNDRAVIGDSPRRREDARFVTGRGAYLDDLRFDGALHAVFVRSPHAHRHTQHSVLGSCRLRIRYLTSERHVHSK